MEENTCFVLNNLELVFDQELVSYNDFPVFFTCKDGKSVYLVLCTDIDNMHYLIAKTTRMNLLKMLDAQISMREAILNCSEYWVVDGDDKIENDSIVSINRADVDVNDLPVEEAKYRIVNSIITDYRNSLRKELFCDQLWEAVHNISKSIDTQPFQDIESVLRASLYIDSLKVDCQEFINLLSSNNSFTISDEVSIKNQSEGQNEQSILKESWRVSSTLLVA